MSNALKKKYIQPRIETVILDYEISLALESAPPSGPDEANNWFSAPNITSANKLLQEYI